MEDVAVAYGFDKLPKTFPATNTVAAPLPINKLADIMRRECAYNGWVEVLPLILCSHDENFGWLNRKDDGKTAVVLENPKTAEYQVVRTSLLPGLLKAVRENRKHALPLRTFEVSDVAFQHADELERCARNQRHVAAVYCDKTASFEVVHGLLDRLMLALAVPRIPGAHDPAPRGYWLQQAADPAFFPGRAATVHIRLPAQQYNPAAATHSAAPDSAPTPSALDSLKDAITNALPATHPRDRVVGNIGVIHPHVLKNFAIDYPCSALEFDLQPFL
jgi:phenylalanyl-tRNA synthetase beta chain